MLLSFSKQLKAIEYNRRRTFDDALIKQIQHLVGVQNDGIIGRKTVEAIAFWQQNNNLAADGKIGCPSQKFRTYREHCTFLIF